MTTRELRALLLRLDPDENMEVICSRFSDFQAITDDEVTVMRGVPKPTAQYVMRTHPTMSPEDVAAVRDFIHFEGN